VATSSQPAPLLPECVPAPAADGRGAGLADYAELTKPGIMLLILTTALGAMLFAADGWPGLRVTVVALAGLALSSGGGAALNHYLDRDLDAAMKRTAARPIPAGRVSPRAALGFGVALIAASFLVLAVGANLLAALLAVGGALVYVLVYTAWLKRRTPQNIVIGGSAGAIPPLVGWSAVTGHVGLPALFMFAIIFYWTPPHFWALALLAKGEYARARVPMLPVVRGERETARQIMLYTLLLVGVSLLPFAARSFGWLYLGCALGLGGWFLVLAWRLLRDHGSRPAARRVFLYSLVYLALMFVAIGVDRVRLS
jgi:protoheme IX farnesyltransferase